MTTFNDCLSQNMFASKFKDRHFDIVKYIKISNYELESFHKALSFISKIFSSAFIICLKKSHETNYFLYHNCMNDQIWLVEQELFILRKHTMNVKFSRILLGICKICDIKESMQTFSLYLRSSIKCTLNSCKNTCFQIITY